MEMVSEDKCFGGVQGVYSHVSEACSCKMTFGLFQPREAADGPVPLLWFLGGLTCTHENAMVKAHAQGWAAEAGIALVFPDTSPRGEGVADDDAFDLGQGAGFYTDATEAPWAAHFQMRTYVLDELPALLGAEFALDMERQAITGHSMGGHGALTLAMDMPGRFKSVSAFSPICNTHASDWGRKQFQAYLGDPEGGLDASKLMTERGFDGPVLIETGTDDKYWDLLGTGAMVEAMGKRRQAGEIHLRQGYDHSYFFVQSFLEDHVAFHAGALWG